MRIELPAGLSREEIQRRVDAGAVPPEDRLLTPDEVAQLFRVSPKTVTRWAKAGKLTCVFTLGGHRRYRETECLAIIHGSKAEGQS